MENDNPPRLTEKFLADLRSGMRDDLDGVKREILDAVREIDSSLETIAREMSRRGGND